MTNPLLEKHTLPPFSQITAVDIEPAIAKLIAENLKSIDELLASSHEFNWENLVHPIEELDDRLNKAWSPVSHMNSVINSDDLRDAYNACLPILSEYSTELGQNEKLYNAYQFIAEQKGFDILTTAQKKIIENALRDFRLSGVALEESKKQRYKQIAQRLSKLSSKYEENVLDATQAWTKHLEDESALVGLPETARSLARQTAESKGMSGWLLTLDFPSYYAVMTYADDRDLRFEVYQAYSTRASDQGPHSGKWDNSTIMDEILSLRHEKSQLLGFQNFAELSIATKMALSPKQVVTFLEDLVKNSLPIARKDLQDLHAFAQNNFGIDSIEAWDLGYFSEKLRQHQFDFSQEEVRAYFPVNRVIPGLFAVVKRLYGLEIKETENIDTWHPDVKFYDIRDADNELRGRFYLDLYARTKKRGGAWMDECVTRKKNADKIQTPVAYLTCNFTPPTGNDPALLTHTEVITLFHEFGHGLHHMLTQVDYLGVSGIHGVEWDAVELPSQFMENWCWEKDALKLISGHYQTEETLPAALFKKMHAAKNFQSGMQMVRQLEFSLFDFLIHMEYEPEKDSRIYQILEQVRKRVAVVKPPSFNRFAHGFSHIFAGGYGAGYYSYKWAEVLSSDAFSLFEENGIFDWKTGQSFLRNILEKGGSQNAMDLFVAFRGREPKIDALLRHNGISVD